MSEIDACIKIAGHIMVGEFPAIFIGNGMHPVDVGVSPSTTVSRTAPAVLWNESDAFIQRADR
jgi:hypothetical protein